MVVRDVVRTKECIEWARWFYYIVLSFRYESRFAHSCEPKYAQNVKNGMWCDLCLCVFLIACMIYYIRAYGMYAFVLRLSRNLTRISQYMLYHYTDLQPMRWQISALVLWLATSDKSLGFAFLAGWLMIGNTTNQKVLYIYLSL